MRPYSSFLNEMITFQDICYMFADFALESGTQTAGERICETQPQSGVCGRAAEWLDGIDRITELN